MIRRNILAVITLGCASTALSEPRLWEIKLLKEMCIPYSDTQEELDECAIETIEEYFGHDLSDWKDFLPLKLNGSLD